MWIYCIRCVSASFGRCREFVVRLLMFNFDNWNLIRLLLVCRSAFDCVWHNRLASRVIWCYVPCSAHFRKCRNSIFIAQQMASMAADRTCSSIRSRYGSFSLRHRIHSRNSEKCITVRLLLPLVDMIASIYRQTISTSQIIMTRFMMALTRFTFLVVVWFELGVFLSPTRTCFVFRYDQRRRRRQYKCTNQTYAHMRI